MLLKRGNDFVMGTENDLPTQFRKLVERGKLPGEALTQNEALVLLAAVRVAIKSLLGCTSELSNLLQLVHEIDGVVFSFVDGPNISRNVIGGHKNIKVRRKGNELKRAVSKAASYVIVMEQAFALLEMLPPQHRTPNKLNTTFLRGVYNWNIDIVFGDPDDHYLDPHADFCIPSRILN